MNQVTQIERAPTWGTAVSAAIFALLATSLHAAPASRFVECETFADYGGWVVDPHSMKRMGSSYLMAHGYGTPVKDATRIVNFAEAGRYTVWARTRDWSAEWRKGRGTPPGRFQVLVNGRPVGDAVLGTNGGTWAWQRAGEVDLPAGDATVALHDLTGFNARCDVVYFSKDPDDVGRQRVLPFQGHGAFPHLAEAASDDAARPRRDREDRPPAPPRAREERLTYRN